MSLKETRTRRQQMLQALVEFQRKAVNMQQTVTIIDALHVAGFLPAITSRNTKLVSAGKRRRDPRVPPKARPDSGGPTAGEGAHLTACGEPMGVDHSVPTLPCREK